MRRELLDTLAAYLEMRLHRNDPNAVLWLGRIQGGHGIGKSALDPDRQFDVFSLYKQYFLPDTRRVGLDGMKWHSLRHTYASLTAGAGIDIYKVSRWMGHSNASVIDGTYTHLFTTDHGSDMDRLDTFLAGGSGGRNLRGIG